ncbi:MAG: SRPBCC family protein [Sandaracinaceae bacterium]|nr:SRPBCC family protein [Sandaracinaceae bacterium]
MVPIRGLEFSRISCVHESVIDARNTFCVGCALAWACFLLPTARAEEDALRSPTAAPSPAEIAAIEPWLDRSLFVHVQLTEAFELPQVTVVAQARVGCEGVFEVVRDVDAYPHFMPGLDSLNVEAKEGGIIAYEWDWQAAIFSFHGRSALLPTANGDGRNGFRAAWETHSSDLGRSRRTLRGAPSRLDPNQCLLVMLSRHDARHGFYLARSHPASSLSLSRTLNLLFSVATLARLRSEAERRHGVARPKAEHPTRSNSTLPIDPKHFASWLNRGELFFIETTDGSDLGVVVGMTRIQSHPPERVRRAFEEPVDFCKNLLSGATLREIARTQGSSRYGWELKIPFFGASGEVEIRNLSEFSYDIEAVGGAMRGGRVHVVVHPADQGASSYVVFETRVDPADGLPLVRAVESTEAAFRPGLVASGLLMTFRGLRRGVNEGN